MRRSSAGFNNLRLRELWVTTRPFPSIFIGLFVFVLCLLSAKDQGIEAAQRQWTSSPRVHLNFKSAEQHQNESVLLNANDENRLSLLTQTKELVVVFDRQEKLKPPGHVFVVARADLDSVHILP